MVGLALGLVILAISFSVLESLWPAVRKRVWRSAMRLLPGEDVVERLLGAIPLVALGIDAGVVARNVPGLALYAIALHANVRWTFGPLRYVIASPTVHRWHHTSEDAGLDKN